MRSLLLFIFILSSFSSYAKNRFKVIGYVSGEGEPLCTMQIDAKKITHLHYTFANLINGEVVSDITRNNDSINLIYLNTLKAINPDLKILISIGGDSWSGGFPDAARTETSREKFALSVITFIKKFQLDGAELHWVFKPGGKFGNVFNREDQNNYILLIESVRKKLDEQTTLDKREKYVLSIAGSMERQYVAQAQLSKAQQYIDYITVQTFNYEFTIVNMDGVVKGLTVTGHHTNLFGSRQDYTFRFSADRTIKEYFEARVSREKLVLGVAFFGKGWTKVYDEKNGLCQHAEGKMSEDLSYKNIVQKYLKDSDYAHFRDKYAKARYLYSIKNESLISYEDKMSIRNKMRYIRKNKLGGAFFTEYKQDFEGTLLKSVRKGLRRIRLPFIG